LASFQAVKGVEALEDGGEGGAVVGHDGLWLPENVDSRFSERTGLFSASDGWRAHGLPLA
jgi:hypothetical protein